MHLDQKRLMEHGKRQAMMKLKEEGKSLVDRAALSQLLTLRNRIVKARGIKKSGSDVTPPVPMPATGPWPTFNFGGTGPSSTEKKGDEEPSKEGFKFEALTPIEPTPLPPIPKFDFKFEFGTSGDKDKEKKSEGSSALQPATFAFEYKPIEFNFNFDKKEEPTAFEQKEELGEKRDYAGIIKATQDQTKVLGENVAPPSEPVLTSVLATSQETAEDAPEPVEPTPEPLKSGEEDEQVIVSRDAKAYEFVEGQWRERGVGQLRVLQPLAASENSDEASKGRTRVVMRQQKTGRLLINSFVWTSMPLNKKDKALYFSAIATTPVPAMFCARFKTLDDCTAVFDEMQRAKDQAPADSEDKKSTAAESKSEGASASKPESENKSSENGDGQDGEVVVV
jgi:hypothetical protein